MVLCAVEPAEIVEVSSVDFPPDLFDGEAGDWASGSENMRAPSDGCESHEGVWPMTFGMMGKWWWVS